MRRFELYTNLQAVLFKSSIRNTLNLTQRMEAYCADVNYSLNMVIDTLLAVHYCMIRTHERF